MYRYVASVTELRIIVIADRENTAEIGIKKTIGNANIHLSKRATLYGNMRERRLVTKGKLARKTE